MFLLWLKFLVCAAIVVFSGSKLSRYGERIAEITKIGHTLVGLILLAIITSLPELSVAISATKLNALDLALGDLFGSNLFNITIVGILFFIFVKQPRQLNFQSTHFMSSGFSVLLIALAAMGITFYNFIRPQIAYSRFLLDVEPVLILAIYFFATYLIFKSEKTKAGGSHQVKTAKLQSGSKVWLQFFIFSVILVSSAIYLAKFGDEIARIPIGGVALGGTFVGSLFMAISTSLPEVVVAISAVRIGALDMALGNIFGSNMFNMLIIPITDLVLGRKVILSCASSVHLFTILFVVISSCIVMAGLVYRSRRKVSALAWDSASIVFIYFAANIVNFYLR